MKINLISDTVTKPTKGMLSAMMSAKVGDDVFKTDPTVNKLQSKKRTLVIIEALVLITTFFFIKIQYIYNI